MNWQDASRTTGKAIGRVKMGGHIFIFVRDRDGTTVRVADGQSIPAAENEVPMFADWEPYDPYAGARKESTLVLVGLFLLGVVTLAFSGATAWVVIHYVFTSLADH